MRTKLFVSFYFFLLGILGISFLLPSKIVVTPSRIDMPADGLSRHSVHVAAKMPFARRWLFPHPKITAQTIQGSEFVDVFPKDEVRLGRQGAQFVIKSRAAEGEAVVRFQIHNAAPADVAVLTHTVSADADGDGFPDAFKLDSYSDRENFRRAFCAIAEQQANQITSDWPVEQRDSAGLVCFAMREALRRHNNAWQRHAGLENALPSIEKFNFPVTPLGDKIFRTKSGPYFPGDLDNGAFVECVTSADLLEFNIVFVSRDPAQAQDGDLLFFSRNPKQGSDAMVMIFVKGTSSGKGGQFPDAIVVSMTPHGGVAHVERTSLESLKKNVDAWLLPIESNKNFLGFYRLKIVR